MHIFAIFGNSRHDYKCACVYAPANDQRISWPLLLEYLHLTRWRYILHQQFTDLPQMNLKFLEFIHNEQLSRVSNGYLSQLFRDLSGIIFCITKFLLI